MEKFWNIIHYFVYKNDYSFHLLFNKINPIYYFYKLPFAKKHFQKMGIKDPIIEANKAFYNPDYGLSSIRAGGFMYVLIIILGFSIYNLYWAIFKIKFHVTIYPFLIIFVISFIVNYFLLFKHDKYIGYFRTFEKLKQNEKRKWGWISFAVIFSIFVFFICSFIFMTHQLKY